MDLFVVDPARLVSEIEGYVCELKTVFTESSEPISDDTTLLHKFCVKLETLLRHEQKEKYTLLGVRKDYWNYMSDCLSRDEGVRYIQTITQLRTPQGKGRGLIRYSLVQRSLADTLQRCLVSTRNTSDWYRSKAALRHPALSNRLVNCLYELNEVDFNISCTSHDLDMSWPAFARRAFSDRPMPDGRVRRDSLNSITSTDLRNDRPDPLIQLSVEIHSLKELLSEESPLSKSNDEGFDNVSIADSTRNAANITELTLDVSRVHQSLLRWKAQMGSQINQTEQELKRAKDEKEMAARELQLRIKQLQERHMQLSKLSSEETDAKSRTFAEKMNENEAKLRERDETILQLEKELKSTNNDLQSSQKTAASLEMLLAGTKHEQTELKGTIHELQIRLSSREKLLSESEGRYTKIKSHVDGLDKTESDLRSRLGECEGSLKAKTVELDKLQEAFEKVNGLVFGSFEELESQLKTRLVDKERGLDSKSSEVKVLEMKVLTLEQESKSYKDIVNELNVKSKQSVEHSETLRMEIDKLKSKIENETERRRKAEIQVNKIHETLGVPDLDVDEEDGNGLSKRILSMKKELVLFQEESERSKENIRSLEEHNSERKLLSDKQTNEINRLIQKISSLEKVCEECNIKRTEITKAKKDIEEICKNKEEEISSLLEKQTALENDNAMLKNQLQSLTEQVQNENMSRVDVETQYDDLVVKINQLSGEKLKLLEQVETLGTKKSELEHSRSDLVKERDSVQHDYSVLVDEKEHLVEELKVEEAKLLASNEGRIQAEKSMIALREKLQSAQCQMDQETSSLKFQISSEAMKYQRELKSLQEQLLDYESLRDRVSESDETIRDLETRLKERNEAWQHEKNKHNNDAKMLKNELVALKNNIDSKKKRISTLENELNLSTKSHDDEILQNNQIKKEYEDENIQLKKEIAQLKEDMSELKMKLVRLISEKDDLWKKSIVLEHEVKVKATDRWVDDGEVTQCTGCKSEFSLFLRKHHCRSCGRIFCYSCCDNWTRSAHSRKQKRVCKQCLRDDKALKVQLSKTCGSGDEEDSRSDVGESRHSSSFLSTEGYTSDTPSDNVYSTSTPIKSNSANTDTTTLESSDDSAEDHFEIVDHSDTQPNEERPIIFSDGDLTCDPLLPAINDTTEEWATLTIPAGQRYVLPVVVATKDCQLRWQFKSSPKRVAFAVAYKRSERAKNKDSETRWPLGRCNSHIETIEGAVRADKPGIYILVFDNTHSRLKNKKVIYQVRVLR